MLATSKKIKQHRLTNYMEELANEVLGSLVAEDKKRRFSSDAIEDIKALALNRLWPMYVTTDSGKDFVRKIVAEDRIEKDVVRELRAAMDIVKSHPRK